MNKAKKIICTISVVVVIACVIGALILTVTAIAGGIERDNYIEEKRTEFHSKAREEWGRCLFVDKVPEDAYSVKYGGYDAVIEESMVVLTRVEDGKYRYVSLGEATLDNILNAKQLWLQYRIYHPTCTDSVSYMIEQYSDFSSE